MADKVMCVLFYVINTITMLQRNKATNANLLLKKPILDFAFDLHFLFNKNCCVSIGGINKWTIFLIYFVMILLLLLYYIIISLMLL